MREVTKEEFFTALYRDPRDIMPTIINDKYPYKSEWRTQNGDRALFGESHDGKYWLSPK